MDFCEHYAATLIAEFDDARAEKLKKIKLPQHRFSLIFSRWVQTTPQMGHEMSRFLVNF